MKRERVPVTPWVLGLAGLFPFLAFTAASALAPAPFDQVSISGFFVYAALILSFLGGTRWGFELGTRPDYPSVPVLVGSNLPAIAGWFGVMLQLVAPVIGLAVLAVSLVLIWVWDLAASGRGQRQLPAWYPRLRTVLTLVVLACSVALWYLHFR